MQRYGVFTENVVIPESPWDPNRIDIQRSFVFNPASCYGGGPPIQSSCYRASIPSEGFYAAVEESPTTKDICNPCDDFNLTNVIARYGVQGSSKCPYFFFNAGKLSDSASLMCIDDADQVKA